MSARRGLQRVRFISFLARSATVFYTHPDVIYVPVSDLAPDQVCLAVAASRVSPVVDDFLAAAQTTAEITAESGNNEMWQMGGGGVSQPRLSGSTDVSPHPLKIPVRRQS